MAMLTHRWTLMLGLCACGGSPPQASLEACTPLPLPSTSTWREVRQPEASFRIPPAYRDLEAIRGEQEIGISYGTDSSRASLYYGRISVRDSPSESSEQRSECEIPIGGRSSKLVIQKIRHGEEASKVPRWFVTAYWGEVEPDRHLSLVATVDDSTRLPEAVAIVLSAQLPSRWSDSIGGRR